jgi:(E)-4-hydroxy-3-methylbut-2-enyl-diphosphate synthase
MGCVVNGPGEARDADIGIAGGKGEALLIVKGATVKKIKEDAILETLKKYIEEMTHEKL